MAPTQTLSKANQPVTILRPKPRRNGGKPRALLLTTAPGPLTPKSLPRFDPAITITGVIPLADLQARLASDKPDILALLLSRHAPLDLRDKVLDLHKTGLPVYIIPWSPPLNEETPTQRERFAPPLSRRASHTKRAFDLLLSVPLLVISLPVLLAVAITVRRDSPGPALFRQWRIGQHGKPFLMYKFRTMHHQTEQAEAGLAGENPLNVTTEREFKLPDDPRITSVGSFLRRSSLDELPQLLNVVRGEMSLVGPRPELRNVVNRYATWQLARLAVPQGMTGWWQVNGRSNRPTALQMQDDLFYLQNCSLKTDLLILIRTFLPVLRGTGAY